MKKTLLSLMLAVFLVGTMVIGVGAQTVSFSIDEWFADFEIDEEPLSVESSVNLTTLTGQIQATDKIGINLAYTFGETDDLKFAGITIDETAQDISIVQFGGDYLVANGVKLGGGYLTSSINGARKGQYLDMKTDISGVYAQASAELPLNNGLVLKGKLAFSPFLTAEVGDMDEEADVTYTTFDIGAAYNFHGFDINGGYRHTSFSFDDVDGDAGYTLSGLYLGVTVGF